MRYKNIDLDIREVQEVQLEILKEFDRICRSNNIRYQLFGGTLLGAIRHKGFIPWDDDIDVCLLRVDYDRLLKVCLKELDEKFFLQNYKTDKNYPLQFSKIRKKNTLFLEGSLSELDINHGVYIDIFPLDKVRPGSLIGKVQQRSLEIVQKIDRSRIKEMCKSNNKLIMLSRLIIHRILKIIPISLTHKVKDGIACNFNDESADTITHLTNNVTKERYYKYMMSVSDFENIIYYEFEEGKYPIPLEFDNVLKKLYGNYKELPPNNMREPHHGVIEIKL